MMNYRRAGVPHWFFGPGGSSREHIFRVKSMRGARSRLWTWMQQLRKCSKTSSNTEYLTIERFPIDGHLLTEANISDLVYATISPVLTVCPGAKRMTCLSTLTFFCSFFFFAWDWYSCWRYASSTCIDHSYFTCGFRILAVHVKVHVKVSVRMGWTHICKKLSSRAKWNFRSITIAVLQCYILYVSHIHINFISSTPS